MECTERQWHPTIVSRQVAVLAWILGAWGLVAFARSRLMGAIARERFSESETSPAAAGQFDVGERDRPEQRKTGYTNREYAAKPTG